MPEMNDLRNRLRGLGFGASQPDMTLSEPPGTYEPMQRHRLAETPFNPPGGGITQQDESNLGLAQFRPGGIYNSNERLRSPIADDATGNIALAMQEAGRGGSERIRTSSVPMDGPAPGPSFGSRIKDKLISGSSRNKRDRDDDDRLGGTDGY